VDQRDAIIGKEGAHLSEEGEVVVDAHVLEHADRDNAIEAAVYLAIVLKIETHRARQALLGGPLARETELLSAERHPGHIAANDLGQIEREPAPARADVEHALTGFHRKLGS
jgi:hypothetical protein